MLSCEDIARQSCGMVLRWRFLATFLGPAFAASRLQHPSDLHSKFGLGPHHLRKKEDRKKKEETIGQIYNGPLLHRADIKSFRESAELAVCLRYRYCA